MSGFGDDDIEIVSDTNVQHKTHIFLENPRHPDSDTSYAPSTRHAKRYYDACVQAKNTDIPREMIIGEATYALMQLIEDDNAQAYFDIFTDLTGCEVEIIDPDEDTDDSDTDE